MNALSALLFWGMSFLLIPVSPSAHQPSTDFRPEGNEIGEALKEALEVGISKASEELAKTDGYYKSPYKILLPENARSVAGKISKLPGFGDFERDLEEKINRAAEDAANKAKPIFVDAIRKITFKDAADILRGEDDAATQYLNRTTYDPLYKAFHPVIKNSLEEVGAIGLWEKGINSYNKLPFVKKQDPDIDRHVTEKALEGLFERIALEEKAIREKPVARTTDLLKKVFGSL